MPDNNSRPSWSARPTIVAGRSGDGLTLPCELPMRIDDEFVGDHHLPLSCISSGMRRVWLSATGAVLNQAGNVHSTKVLLERFVLRFEEGSMASTLIRRDQFNITPQGIIHKTNGSRFHSTPWRSFPRTMRLGVVGSRATVSLASAAVRITNAHVEDICRVPLSLVRLRVICRFSNYGRNAEWSAARTRTTLIVQNSA